MFDIKSFNIRRLNPFAVHICEEKCILSEEIYVNNIIKYIDICPYIWYMCLYNPYIQMYYNCKTYIKMLFLWLYRYKCLNRIFCSFIAWKTERLYALNKKADPQKKINFSSFNSINYFPILLTLSYFVVFYSKSDLT